MAGRELSEAQLEAMSDEQRRAWLAGDEDAAQTEDESEDADETPGDSVGQEQQDDATETEAPQGRDWNPDGPGDLRQALKSERQAKKSLAEENKQLKGNLDQLTGQVGQLTQMVQYLMSQGASQKEATAEAQEILGNASEAEFDEAPDIEDDPLAWARYIESKAEGRIKQVEEAFNEYRRTKDDEQRVAILQWREQEFVKVNPDYYEVVNLADTNSPLTRFYVANPTVYQQHMAAEDPVAAAYDFGKALLIAESLKTGKPLPGAGASVPTLKVTSKSAPPSLATVPSNKERYESALGDLSEEEAATLSSKDRERWLRSQ